jgi:cell fate regulator YaaT (PSP1 superfamily)
LNQSFEKQLAIERRKAVLEDGAKLEEMILKLRETEDNLSTRNLNVKYLEGLFELKDGQSKEVEARLLDLLAKVNGDQEINLMEKFKKENKEKKILYEKIMELTEL